MQLDVNCTNSYASAADNDAIKAAPRPAVYHFIKNAPRFARRSTWKLASFTPLKGPTILRVLGPQSHLVVTDLTTPCCEGRGMDGVVHRLVFKLVAGGE